MKKKIIIGPYTRKQRGKKRKVRKHSKFVKITPHKRQVFKHMSSTKQKKEFGGFMDFDKSGKLEAYYTVFGDLGIVNIPSDYEILWHTHPRGVDRYEYNIPSPEDFIEISKSKKQKAEVIFGDGKALIIVKPKNARPLTKKDIKNLNRFFHINKPSLAKTYMARKGYKFIEDKNPDKTLKIPIKPVE